MKEVHLADIVSPEHAIEQLLSIYKALRVAATRENNLRAFLIADLMIVTLNQAEEMRWRKIAVANKERNVYYWYNCEPKFWWPDDSDTIDDILKMRFIYVHNPAIA